MDYLDGVKTRFDYQQFVRMVGCLIGIGFLGILWAFYDLPLLIASLGSTAITLYALPKAPAARPKNAIIGQVSSAICGWCVQFTLGTEWYSCALAVALSLIVMVLLDCVHPPGGATALSAVLTPQPWTFIIAPVFIGVVFLVIVAYICNRICDKHENKEESK